VNRTDTQPSHPTARSFAKRSARCSASPNMRSSGSAQRGYSTELLARYSITRGPDSDT